MLRLGAPRGVSRALGSAGVARWRPVAAVATCPRAPGAESTSISLVRIELRRTFRDGTPLRSPKTRAAPARLSYGRHRGACSLSLPGWRGMLLVSAMTQPAYSSLIDKIQALPPEKVAEVEDFVDFLRQRSFDRQLVAAAAKLAEPALGAVWDNPDDAVYDRM